MFSKLLGVGHLSRLAFSWFCPITGRTDVLTPVLQCFGWILPGRWQVRLLNIGPLRCNPMGKIPTLF